MDLLVIWIGALATLAIFSFLLKENPLYRFFEHLFMGLSLGWGIVLTWTRNLEPRWFKPLCGLDVPPGGEYSYANLLWILALFAGAMWYFIFTRRFKWIARIVIGLFIGVGAGLGIQGFFRLFLPQITGNFKSLWPARASVKETIAAAWNNLVFLVTFYSAMAYFLFTFKREGAVLRNVATAGRWLMMIAFGAMFGSTVMARLSLFIERMYFLLGDWLRIVN
jgi:hypothetical protein